MKKIANTLMMFFLLFSLTACKEEVKEGYLKYPYSASYDYDVNYKDLALELKEMGFTNIQSVPLENLITGWINKEDDVKEVSIVDNFEFDSNEWIKTDTLISIYYHSFPIEKDPLESEEKENHNNSEQNLVNANDEEEALESVLELNFPSEMARRAIVVAVTNYFATDVIASDGFSLDTSKFHSFSDQSGNLNDYFILIKNEGDWKAISKDTWKVSNFKLEHYAGLKLNVNFTITQKNNEYLLTDPSGYMGNDKTFNEISNNPEVLIVPKRLIEEPREKDIQTYSSWVNQQFSSYDGSHKVLKKLVKDSVYDGGSVENIKTEHISMIDNSYLDEYNTILKSAGVSIELEINDLFLIMDFKSRDINGNKIESTAYGIVKYSNSITHLLSIEQ